MKLRMTITTRRASLRPRISNALFIASFVPGEVGTLRQGLAHNVHGAPAQYPQISPHPLRVGVATPSSGASDPRRRPP